MFLTLFISSFAEILKILLLGIIVAAILGGFRGNQAVIDTLNILFIRVTLPCLIFTNMVKSFRPGEMDTWWIFPLLGIGHFLAGGFLAYGYSRIDRAIMSTEVFISSVAFHNSILLPLAIAPVLFGPEKLEHFLSLLFLYNLLAVPAFFTAGVWLMNRANGVHVTLKHFSNPPIIATIAGLIIALTGLYKYVPTWFIAPLEMLGSLTTPLSIIIVGGIILVSIPHTSRKDLADPIKIAVLKCLVLPSIVCAVICILHPPEYIALFLILGAAMPVGSTLAVICPAEQRLQKLVAGGILFSSIASIPAVSLFMSLYSMVYGK